MFMEIAVRIKNLSFTYGGSKKSVIKDVNLEIKKGEFVLLLGHSGAGKSTLCMSMNRIIPELINGEISGEIKVFGRDLSRESVSHMGEFAGIVLQDYESQIFSTRVDLEIAFGLENMGMSREMMRKRVRDVLEMTGLADLANRNPATLSGGQKQRLAIASVIAMEPDLIILDEPLTDLDPQGRKEVLAVLYRLKEMGKTIVFVEHDYERMNPDTCIVLESGRVLFSEIPEDAFKKIVEQKIRGIKPHPIAEFCKIVNLEPEKLEIGFISKKMGRPRRSLVNGQVKNQEKETIIEFENVNFTYDEKQYVLKNINLKIKKGDFVALVGHNGCGKTTLAKHINRLLVPSEGSVRIFGEDTRKLSRSQIGKKVGYVFQNPDHQIFSETVFDEIAFAPKNFGLDEATIRRNVSEAIEIVGLKGYEESDPFILSRGEREKVAVASVLAVAPEILILDEPTTGLDYHERRNTMEMLKRLNREGKTIIIITHSMDIVAEYARSVIAMKSGEVIFHGDVRNFFNDMDLLKKLSIEPPLITELGWELGVSALNVEELAGVFL